MRICVIIPWVLAAYANALLVPGTGDLPRLRLIRRDVTSGVQTYQIGIWLDAICRPSESRDPFRLSRSSANPFKFTMLVTKNARNLWSARELGVHDFDGSVTIDEGTNSGVVLSVGILFKQHDAVPALASLFKCCTGVLTMKMYINAISSEVEDLNESRFTIYCQPHFRAGRNPLCSLAAVGNPETMTECKTRASHDFVLPGEEEERVWSFNLSVASLCTASLDPSLPPIAVKAVSTGSPPVRLDFDIAAGGENEPWKIKLLRPPSTDIYAV